MERSHRSSAHRAGSLSAPAQKILAALRAQHAGRVDRGRHNFFPRLNPFDTPREQFKDSVEDGRCHPVGSANMKVTETEPPVTDLPRERTHPEHTRPETAFNNEQAPVVRSEAVTVQERTVHTPDATVVPPLVLQRPVPEFTLAPFDKTGTGSVISEKQGGGYVSGEEDNLDIGGVKGQEQACRSSGRMAVAEDIKATSAQAESGNQAVGLVKTVPFECNLLATMSDVTKERCQGVKENVALQIDPREKGRALNTLHELTNIHTKAEGLKTAPLENDIRRDRAACPNQNRTNNWFLTSEGSVRAQSSKSENAPAPEERLNEWMLENMGSMKRMRDRENGETTEEAQKAKRCIHRADLSQSEYNTQISDRDQGQARGLYAAPPAGSLHQNARSCSQWEPPRPSHGAPKILWECRGRAGGNCRPPEPSPALPVTPRVKGQIPAPPAGGKGARPTKHAQRPDKPSSCGPPQERGQRAKGKTSEGPELLKQDLRSGSTLREHKASNAQRPEERNQTTRKPSPALTFDPRVWDTGRLSEQERGRVLEEAGLARVWVITMVYQDGTTQLDPEQKSLPSVCGMLVGLRTDLGSAGADEANSVIGDRLLYLRLEQRPAWAQQPNDQRQDLFTSSPDPVNVLDPQIAAWLLDPADTASCFRGLVGKHCRIPVGNPDPVPAAEPRRVTQVIASVSLLYRLMVELRTSLQAQGLWQLYVSMEQKMIPVLAAMESHRIHVDKGALKKTSEMLGTKMKQLEQEAHKAAGQQFLVSSSAQLRLVLFDKLRLHERCENKKLPKTMLKQQQSTSEAALLQLQDLHPLPKIILEYRQIHKIKSTFVDGILSCVKKTFVSSTWNQTSAVSGRLSAKHPNFQALPKQPVHIIKKQHVQGREAEVVTVHPRAMFIPREDWTFLSADFCQVELRLLAHLSSDPELLRIFRNPDADVFTMLASQWKGVGEEGVSSEDREHAKRIVYSVVYGAGKERLSGILGVSAEQASHFQDSFLNTYREVQAFIQKTVQQCHKHGYVVSIMGRRRALPHIRSSDWNLRSQAERQAVNFVVQGSAADLCKMAMIQIFSRVSSSPALTARLVAQIHDELLFEVENSQVEDFAVLVKKTMESLQHIDSLGVHLTVPLKVSLSSGRSWGAMSELILPNSPTSASH
ncbi:DNA polymerase nu [Chanos chanos]|uniref:DNA-directed DNA polymerase n=1 Tax=Chanos chanos TaxID=29144 RepID=A0A6J2VVH3_CHACN|nr:DNA polymerase nu [Chanos chanos]